MSSSSIKFCDLCDNIMFLLHNNQGKLEYRCRNCNFYEHVDENHSHIVSETKIGEDQDASYKQYITPNIRHDVTLPRVNNIMCPNKKCPHYLQEGKQEVIYIKYDQINMKYLYFCCNCDGFWRNNSNDNQDHR